jgi:hypothetical protein
MKGNWFAFVIALAAAGLARGQIVVPLGNIGPRPIRINVVFLAEGYTTAEYDTFKNDATRQFSALINNEAWSRFADSINGFGIFVASAESGADDPGTNTVRDTYFNGTFDTAGIDRLLTIDSDGMQKAYAILARTIPDYDIAIVLVNSTKYGGSGGSLVVTSVNTAANEIMLHELGHSFANLTDEYVDDSTPPGADFEYPNATKQTERGLVPWSEYILPSTSIPTASLSSTYPLETTVGLFQGAAYQMTYYRPTNNSKMRSLDRPFGPVNLDAFATAVHRLDLNSAKAPPLITDQPASAIVPDGSPWTLRVMATGTGPITYHWLFNGTIIPDALSSSYNLVPMTASRSGTYCVRITNSKGTVASDSFTITAASIAVAPVVQITSKSDIGASGSTIALSSVITGTAPISLQWYKDNKPVIGATSNTLTITHSSTGDTGTYTLVAANSNGTTTSNPAIVTIQGAEPTIVALPTAQAATIASNTTFTVVASGDPSPAYQWMKDGVALADNSRVIGANTATLRLLELSQSDAGNYTVVIHNGIGTITSSPVTLSVIPAVWISNLSVRANMAAAQTMIVGLTVTNDAEPVMVRAAGPALADVFPDLFSRVQVMADPRIALYAAGSTTPTLAVDNWNTATLESTPFSVAGAFPFFPNSLDAALVHNIAGPNNTVWVQGAGPGDVLVECYGLSSSGFNRLTNISARNRIANETDALVAGFALTGNGTKRLLIRGIGSRLYELFGIADAMLNPKLEVYDSMRKLVAENDDWDSNIASTFDSVGAFALKPGSKDAALILTVPVAGTVTYTAQLKGADGDSGEAMIEVYELP